MQRNTRHARGTDRDRERTHDGVLLVYLQHFGLLLKKKQKTETINNSGSKSKRHVNSNRLDDEKPAQVT